ncbi:hypothetical protein HDF24_11760 [Mucilaginibacter sp. X4EP1]|uniref:hypothetical protein n=1 Tax=Mucilaginibacter sp. X4EP1 TaxID=2723092 RepID=UPI002168943E|nr:hypothetical protein [Mucilaginibacter sp. X4EP1]MCS3812934.1 translation elongation factor EF-Ts [Mucilaginibacter sp. X4EP1]
MIKFSIKIDDEDHTLSKENGIPINEIAPLLASLFNAIDTGSGEKLTLGQVRGNCYALDFYSEDAGYLNNFTAVHRNIQEISLEDLEPEQQKYASNLKTVLGNKYYLTAYDSESKELAVIANIEPASLIQFYYTSDTIYGVVSELGSGNRLSAKKKHICIDGFSNRISISKEQDIDLKQYYGSHQLRVEVRQKRSIIDGRIVSCELEDFVILSENSLTENLKSEGYVDFELIKNTHTIEDILNRIYAIK